MKKKEKYDLIFSIGSVCSCSMVLRTLGLQDFSYPFDWTGIPPLKNRIEILVSEFKDWFNFEDFEYSGQRLSPEPCDYYKNNRTGFLFLHDFKINTPLEESFPVVKERYERRTKRLIEFINKSQKILMVFIEDPKCDNRYSMEYLKECLKLMTDKYPDKDIRIKYLYNDDNPIHIEDGGVEIYAFNYLPPEGETSPGALNVDKIKKEFLNIKLKRKITLKSIIKFIFNIRISKRPYTTKYNITILGFTFQFKKKRPVEEQPSV